MIGLRRDPPAGGAGGLLMAALAAVGWWLIAPRAPRVEPVAQASELVRLDGRLALRGATHTPFTGWLTEHYAEGTLKSRSHVLEGVLHGVSEGWHTNGLLQVREHFVAGLAEGSVTKWHPNGAKLSEGMAREGRLEGMFRRWHANGVLAEEVTLDGGQPDGLSRAWFPSGHLKAEVVLEQGQVVRQQFWRDGEQPGPGGGLHPDTSARRRRDTVSRSLPPGVAPGPALRR